MKILRIIAISLALAGAVLPGKADTHYKPHMWIGGHAGATMSQMSFSPGVKQSMTQGLTMGAAFTYAEERHVGLRAEINMVQRGWKENYEELPLEYSRHFTYVSLPIMTHIFFGGRKAKFFANLGPEISYMIGKSISSNFDYTDISTVPDYPLPRRTEQLTMDIKNKIDYGITAGIGGEFRINRRHAIQLEARYYFGIGNVFPSKRTDVFHASRCMDIAVTLGYMFRLK